MNPLARIRRNTGRPVPRPGISRRDVARGLGALVAGTAWGPLDPFSLARAAEMNDRSFLFCYFSGGWDLQLCLDPRDPALFRDDLRKVTRIQPGWGELSTAYREIVPTSVAGMEFGPAIGDLARHAERLCVVRGMSMDTLTHEVGRRRFLTGRPPVGLQARGSSVATHLAQLLGADQAMPQLSVGVESYNDGLPSWASAIRVRSVDDLVRALEPSADRLPSDIQDLVDRFIEDQAACSTLRAPFHQDALAFRDASRALVAQGLGHRFDFAAETPEMEALRDLYGIDPEELDSGAAQAAAAVTAITSGISRCVSIVVAENLDSHGPEWASEHAPRIEGGFNLMAAIMDDLDSREHPSGGSWLDRTTIIGFSEFGRSPLLNSSGGRDHYLHNAAVLAGGGIRGGRVIGTSSDVGMAPTPTDLRTGSPSDSGETIRPEHLFRALLTDLGVVEDVAEYGVEPLTALYG